jgi:hypothetical protein
MYSPFQLGNNRMTLIGSNFGTFRIRQDEGGAKWLQDSNKADKKGAQFGGGFGYLIDSKTGKLIDTTYYLSHQRRSFGVGYATTSFGMNFSGVSVAHTVAVPFGDDPVVLIEANLTNHQSEAADIEFVEVWGSRLVHMAPTTAMPDRRKFSDKHYKSTFDTPPPLHSPACIVHRRKFTGPPTTGASLWDPKPPMMFVCALAAPTKVPTTFGNDAKAFFGSGGVQNPAATVVMNGAVAESDTALLTSTKLVLPGDVSNVLPGDTANVLPGVTATRRTSSLLGSLSSSSNPSSEQRERPQSGGGSSVTSLRYVVGYTYSTEATPEALAEKYQRYFSGGLRENIAAEWIPYLTHVKVPRLSPFSSSGPLLILFVFPYLSPMGRCRSQRPTQRR